MRSVLKGVMEMTMENGIKTMSIMEMLCPEICRISMEVFWAIRAHGIRARSDVEVLDWLVTEGRGKTVLSCRRAYERVSVQMNGAYERTVECMSERLRV